jgi:hypothetical protein
MPDAYTLKAVAIATPIVLIALGAGIWLWLRWGMGVYLDAAVAAIAACL